MMNQHDSFTKSRNENIYFWKICIINVACERCSYKLACETNKLISVVGTLMRLSYILAYCSLYNCLVFLFVVYVLWKSMWRTTQEHLKKILIRAILNITIIYKNCLPIFLSILIESNLSPSHNVYAHTYHSRNYWMISFLKVHCKHL